MNRLTLLVAFAVLFGTGLMGCHQEKSFQDLPRAQQEKLMQGDPKKIQEMQAQMAAKYSHTGPPPGAVPAGAQVPGNPSGTH